MPHFERQTKANPNVRRCLIDSAVNLMVLNRFSSVSVADIAKGAGVTKGGFFHHFPNKQVLISAVFDDELKRFDLSIENFLSHESESYGCFTRAYIRSIFIFCTEEASALTFSLCAEPELMTRWDNWLAQRLERHCSTDCSPTLSVARLAADGFWFNHLLKGEKIDISADIKNIQQKLISMTINSDGLVG